ncbi:MAG: SDR family oxidoreductase [Chloroflexota bacterium]|nr:SDR family oxidoreductase [Chloroflexota bacterium]
MGERDVTARGGFTVGAAGADVSMRGRVCLVTGATRGIGKATALGLARLGASVVLLARNAERGTRACDDVRRASGNANVSLVVADLASFASIRAAAANIAERYPAVHVLVNNAGVNLARRTVSADGFEMTFAINHLAPFLLTNLLLPVLRAGVPSRIVNVTSKFERFGRIRFNDLQATRRYGAFRAYTQSKLANVLFTYELAKRLEGTGITANCLHPGLVATDLMRDYPAWMRSLWERFLLTPEQGARTAVYLASAPAVSGVTGRYFEREGREARTSRRSYDVATRERLWCVSAALTGMSDDVGRIAG